MRYLLLLVVAISLSSCAGFYEARDAYYNTPAGMQDLRQQFTLDSIRASRTQYPFNYGFGYYYNRGTFPIYYNYYRPYGNRTVIRRGGVSRTRVTRTTPSRQRQPIRRVRRVRRQ